MHKSVRAHGIALVLVLAVLAVLAGPAAADEVLRIGTVKTAAAGLLFIADARGYFTAEAIAPQFTYFSSPGPVPVAVASGDVDIATTGSSAEIYNLAGQGAIKIIGASAHEWPTFRMNAFVVSNNAAAAGLQSYADLPGHSIGIAEFGGPANYAGALVLEKHHIDLKSVRFVALQNNPNVLSAVTGGRVDAAVLPAVSVVPAAQHDDLKVLSWVGGDAPWQSGELFASTKLLDSNPDLVQRFLIAYRKSARDFHDAFTAADGTRHDQPTAPDILAILQKYTGQSGAQLRLGIPYVDPDGRLDFDDMRHQLAWFKAQNMLKGDITLDKVIDQPFTRWLILIKPTHHRQTPSRP